MNSLPRTVRLTKRWGQDISNPTPQDLAGAIAELAQPDSEHPDCWLSAEDGWSVSLFESGRCFTRNSSGIVELAAGGRFDDAAGEILAIRLRRAAEIEHDPEKWGPVFGKDHAPA
jgi:hypothetical protein